MTATPIWQQSAPTSIFFWAMEMALSSRLAVLIGAAGSLRPLWWQTSIMMVSTIWPSTRRYFSPMAMEHSGRRSATQYTSRT